MKKRLVFEVEEGGTACECCPFYRVGCNCVNKSFIDCGKYNLSTLKLIEEETITVMELKDYTTEELRAEISRRYAAKKAERDARLVCKNCKHFGGISYQGYDVAEDDRERGRFHTSCKFHKTKNGRNYITHKPSQLACEHFERKEVKDESKS